MEQRFHWRQIVDRLLLSVGLHDAMQRTCSLQPRWSHFGKLNEITFLLIREYSLKSIAETETISKAQCDIRMTITSQIFPMLNDSEAPPSFLRKPDNDFLSAFDIFCISLTFPSYSPKSDLIAEETSSRGANVSFESQTRTF
jgi:hypothetical protein